MKAVTFYRAEDGTLYQTEAECIKRDEILSRISEIMRPLREPSQADKRVMDNGKAYIKHRLADVFAARRGLLDIAKDSMPERVATHPHLFDASVHPSKNFIGRIFEDSGDPLSNPWYRLMKTDDKGREWDQPYYVSHPNPDAVSV